MRYEDVAKMSKEEAREKLESGRIADVAAALLSLSYFEADRDWVFDQLEVFSRHPNPEIRGLVASCVGHIGRIDGVIDIVRAGKILDSIALEPGLSGRARDAWEDLEIFTNANGKSSDE